MLKKINPTTTKAWSQLTEHQISLAHTHLNDLMKDEMRFSQFQIQLEDLLFDFSKNIITKDTITLFMKLLDEVDLRHGIDQLFQGSRINETEDRSVMHTALRAPANQSIMLEGEDIATGIHAVLHKIKEFTNAMTTGKKRGYTQKQFVDIVNIGIGGSDLGPVMVTEALKPYWQPGLQVHYVSNVDSSHIYQTLQKLNPETTLFIIASKTFTTQETMANAEAAKQWFLQFATPSDIQHNFAAVSTNGSAVKSFGISPALQFEFWDWVGGRYSASSAVGLSIACTIGYSHFEDFLSGLHQMDEHFRTAPFDKNMPVLLAVLGIWYNNFWNAASHAVLPYDQYLHRLPAYLQQLDMESNGKSVDRSGNSIKYQTGPVIWGEPGTNGQHAFFQLIHQGTKLIPCDFIGVVNSQNAVGDQHDLLLANFLAQTQALMQGRSEAQVRLESNDHQNHIIPFKVFEGSRPTNSILIKILTPKNLGQLLAAYEHKVFVQGYIWNIFSFDQWGVELGKVLAKNILCGLKDEQPHVALDSSTTGLMNQISKWKE